MDEEIELKLAVAPEHVERLRRHPIFRASKQKRASRTRLVSTYYDTPAFELMRKAVALRVRKIGQERVQSIKQSAAAGKSHLVRREWEKPIKGDQPDLTQLGDSRLRRLIKMQTKGNALKPVFVTDVTRQTWPLRIGTSRIECALDVGEIKAEGRRAQLCEVELELKAGAPAKLFELARTLNKSIPLRLEPTSKAARGYSLAAGTPSGASKAQPVQLAPRMRVGEAFAAIARGCIAHIVANVNCAHEGKDPEGVHQLRVGLRRLRAALSVFKDAITPAERTALGGELRWLQRELGPAREWDVFIDSSLHAVAKQLKNGKGLAALVRVAEAHRVKAYERGRAALSDRRYTDLLLRLEAWLDKGLGRRRRSVKAGLRARELPLRDRPIAPFAAEVLRSRHAKVEKLGSKLRKIDDEQIHELRIRVKKLRYATEFFRALFPEKSTKRYISALKALQDSLGTAHDVMVAAEDLIPQLQGGGGQDVERALGQLQGWCAAQRKSDHKQLIRLWDDFARLKPFWKDG